MCMYCMYLLLSMLLFDWNTVHWVWLNYVLLLFSSPKRAIKRKKNMFKISKTRLSDHYGRAHLAIWITHPLDLLKKSCAADLRSGFCWSMMQPITPCCLKIAACHQCISPHLILISTRPMGAQVGNGRWQQSRTRLKWRARLTERLKDVGVESQSL